MPIRVKKAKLLNRKNKDISEKNKNKKNRIVLFLILILIILLGIIVGKSIAKYQNKITGEGFANIAKPILEIRKEQSLLLTALAPKASYVFEVRNYKEDELNEVEMEYYIEIISCVDEAIDFALYKGEEQVELKDNKTEKIKLTKDEKQIHSYRLEITYDETKAVEQKDINENVEVKIHSIQKE